MDHLNRPDKNALLDPSQIPQLLKATALAALGRGVGGWFPYAEDEDKRTRYRLFLEYRGGIRSEIPSRPPSQDLPSQLKELHEFAHAANVFKPMTGAIASRFTSAKSTSLNAQTDKDGGVQSVESKPSDPAEEAAKMGMFGPMTRTVGRFAPTKLLCKRFGVKPPENVVAEQMSGESSTEFETKRDDVLSKETMKKMEAEVQKMKAEGRGRTEEQLLAAGPKSSEQAKVEPERNEALEGQKAGEELFKSIFGDSDED